jgi:hypothetical protein
MRRRQSGQAIVLVAVALLALIGSAALVLLAGSVTWQRNQLQSLADATALDAALKIGIGCSAASAGVVITEADNFLATQRVRTGGLGIAAGTCATPYRGTDTFAGGLTATYNYPYRAHQQQVQVILRLALPISFGGPLGATTTTVTRSAVAQALPGSVPAVSANTINCTAGQVNVNGSIRARNRITLAGNCALYAHQRLSAGAYSSLGNVEVYTDGQVWRNGGARCVAGAQAGSQRAVCSDGYELSGHIAPGCGPVGSEYLFAANLAVNANPCAIGVGRQVVPPLPLTLPPDPNTDPNAVATLQGTGGAPCAPGGVYPNIRVNGRVVGTGLSAPTKQAGGPPNYWHFSPSCYGYLDFSQLRPDIGVLNPGFYYFNGSGFAGGGGICLNGSTVLAQAVTLEFVNRAGFSSSNCAGAGADCRAPCQFGSTPCSIRACPPNRPVDPPFNYTWFGAPCSQAPPGDASCAGSAWCPAGDRSCSNLLIWTPAASTGRFYLRGNAVNGWLLGTIYWAGACTDYINGSSTIAGAISCGTLAMRAAGGAGTAVGGDYGINTATVEAILVE